MSASQHQAAMGSNISKRAGQPLAVIEVMPIVAETSMRWIISGRQHASVRIGTSGSAARTLDALRHRNAAIEQEGAALVHSCPVIGPAFTNRTVQGAEP